MEYYEKPFFRKIAKGLGRFFKVDSHTLREKDFMFSSGASTERARFARICIGVDLRKSLVPKFLFNGKEYMVEYEGLHPIFLKCGCFHHKMDQYSIVLSTVPLGSTPKKGSQKAVPVEVPQFEPWMIVKRPQRGASRSLGVEGSQLGRGELSGSKGSQLAALDG